MQYARPKSIPGALSCLMLGVLMGLTSPLPARHEGQGLPPRAAEGGGAFLGQVLRENALFFSLLTSFSFTAAMAKPAWNVSVRNINVNLISRQLRDEQGRQLVRVRIAGAVRRNNNVELNILDPAGAIVGKGFFGFGSGQVTFYDPDDRPIIDGYMDGTGSFALTDLRLSPEEGQFAQGFVLPCFYCSYMEYGWFDGRNFQVGGGRIFPQFLGIDSNRVRMYWSFEVGRLSETMPAYGEAEYDLASETTGAFNSTLFDSDRNAADFFEHPLNLVPPPPGVAYFPRVGNGTGLSLTSLAEREIEVTYAARRYDGSLVRGEGIENPVTYLFSPGRQYAAYPDEIFRALESRSRRLLFQENEIGWVEAYSPGGKIQGIFLEGDVRGSALDGNVAKSDFAARLLIPDVRIREGEQTEISILNAGYDEAYVTVSLLDARGSVLDEETALFVAGRGLRSFHVGPGTGFFPLADPATAAALRISAPEAESTGGRLAALALYSDASGSISTSYAVSAADAGAVLLGAHFVEGPGGAGHWSSLVRLARIGGTAGQVRLDLHNEGGVRLGSLFADLPAGGQATIPLGGATFLPPEVLTAGYVRAESSSGPITGNVTVYWENGAESQISTYPLSNYLHGELRFNQVAQGETGGVEYWTGVALMNDSSQPVPTVLTVFRPDGSPDRATTIELRPYQKVARLLTELLADPGYERLNGYMRITASQPISGVVFYGDSRSRFLSCVPGQAP